MKKFFTIIAMIFTFLSLSSCYKKEMYTFVEDTYRLKEAVSFDESMMLENVMLSFNEITKAEYEDAENTNVITSRYNDKYYRVSLSMNIDGVNYDNLAITERLGSTAYRDRYHLMFDLNIEEQVYRCHFRMDLHNYDWEKEVKAYESNRIIVSIFESRHAEDKGNGKCYATFNLVLNYDAS